MRFILYSDSKENDFFKDTKTKY